MLIARLTQPGHLAPTRLEALTLLADGRPLRTSGFANLATADKGATAKLITSRHAVAFGA